MYTLCFPLYKISDTSNNFYYQSIKSFLHFPHTMCEMILFRNSQSVASVEFHMIVYILFFWLKKKKLLRLKLIVSRQTFVFKLIFVRSCGVPYSKLQDPFKCRHSWKLLNNNKKSPTMINYHFFDLLLLFLVTYYYARNGANVCTILQILWQKFKLYLDK